MKRKHTSAYYTRRKLARLRRRADKLYQSRYIKEKPRSIVSGEPTEVIHHWIPKSQSNALRYDKDNAIPLTNSEHFAHHSKGDPEIARVILEKKGDKWAEKLQEKRHQKCRFSIGYLKKVIEELEK